MDPHSAKRVKKDTILTTQKMSMNNEKRNRLNALLPWLIPTAFVLIWIGVSEMGLVPTYLLPHPMEIFHAGYIYIFGTYGDGAYSGRFMSDASASILRVGGGFGFAVLIGLPLGILSGRLSLINRLLSTTINALRAVPGISWLPLAMIWFGIGMRATIFLVALAAFFPIYLNSAAGARQMNPLLLQAGAMMGIKRIRGTFAILLPGIMPQIITGLRLGLGISWAYLVLGELTGVPNGLGAVIMDARMLGRIDIIMVGVILIAIMGRMGDQLLKVILKFCFKSARRLT
jgi:sulfonate transport system permease protein